jgi:hypothetical protein
MQNKPRCCFPPATFPAHGADSSRRPRGGRDTSHPAHGVGIVVQFSIPSRQPLAAWASRPVALHVRPPDPSKSHLASPGLVVVSCNCKAKSPGLRSGGRAPHHAAVSRPLPMPLSFGRVRERGQSTPCPFFHRTGGKGMNFLSFKATTASPFVNACVQCFINNKKSIPEQMSKWQRYNFPRAAFRLSGLAR